MLCGIEANQKYALGGFAVNAAIKISNNYQNLTNKYQLGSGRASQIRFSKVLPRFFFRQKHKHFTKLLVFIAIT